MNSPSQLDPVAEIFREQFGARKPELKDGSQVSVYLGWQSGGKYSAGFALYNLTHPVGIPPVGSTVSEQTLNAHGYSAPDIYAHRSTDDNGDLLCEPYDSFTNREADDDRQ